MNVSYMNESKLSRGQAFTLIELLVVISIISLLIAILLPALGQARGAAKMTANLASLRQVQFGLLMYADDNKTSLPWSEFTVYPGSTGRYWGGKICYTGYIANPRTFWSPFRDTSGFDFDILRTSPNHLDWNSSGYSANSVGVMPAESNASQHQPLRLGATKSNMRPSDVLTLTEGYTVFYLGLGKDGAKSVNLKVNATPLFTWQGQSATAFLDGHVKRLSSEKIGWIAIDDRNGNWNATSSASSGYPWYNIGQTSFWDTYYQPFYTQN